jgi:cytochrome c5
MLKFLKVLGVLLGALVVLFAVAFVVSSARASQRLSSKFETHRVELPVPFPLSASEINALRAERAAAASGEPDADPLADADLGAHAHALAIARGKHLVEARYGCNACHGDNMGGGDMMNEPVIAVIRGPNITSGRGGVVAGYTASDWDRIVRHGVLRDGSQATMPSEDFFAMADHELSDIIAYIRSRPPVDNQVPPASFGPIGKVLLALGKYPLSAERVQDHKRAHLIEPPTAADTPEFGAHLSATCLGCHRANLAGGPMQFGPPDWPPAANLTAHASGLASWSFEDFDKSLTDGVSRDGRPLRDPMTHVIPGTRAMSLTERKAIWTYLQSLPALPTNP